MCLEGAKGIYIIAHTELNDEEESVPAVEWVDGMKVGQAGAAQHNRTLPNSSSNSTVSPCYIYDTLRRVTISQRRIRMSYLFAGSARDERNIPCLHHPYGVACVFSVHVLHNSSRSVDRWTWTTSSTMVRRSRSHSTQGSPKQRQENCSSKTVTLMNKI